MIDQIIDSTVTTAGGRNRQRPEGFLLPWDMTFVLALLWVNSPGFPLHYIFGEPHFPVEEFGVIPHGVVGYGGIILFWIIVSVRRAQ